MRNEHSAARREDAKEMTHGTLFNNRGSALPAVVQLQCDLQGRKGKGNTRERGKTETNRMEALKMFS